MTLEQAQRLLEALDWEWDHEETTDNCLCLKYEGVRIWLDKDGTVSIGSNCELYEGCVITELTPKVWQALEVVRKYQERVRG